MDETKKRDGVNDFRRCPLHKTWKKKGICDGCRMAEEKKQREYEKLTGSNKPSIKIIKI